jgi:hypothetical protein
MPDLTCFYCERGDHKPGVPARVTVHDRRGCVHCCDEHATWRLTTSMSVGGHGPECPYREGTQR